MPFQVFRNSFLSHYTVYDVTNDHLIPIAIRDLENKIAATRLQHATWLGNTTALAIINNNNIFVRDSPVGKDTQITITGLPGVIYNGVPDWLYQEDIFASPEALWPSPDGSHIIFATFNDSKVRMLSFPWFGVSSLSSSSNTFGSFPDSKTVRYPTPESPNPKVRLWVVDIKNQSEPVRWEVSPPKTLENQDFYLTSAGWVGDNNQQVGAVWMNRAQNLSIVSACVSPNWTCIETHVERAPENTWLDVQPQPFFSPDGDSFLLLAAVQEGAHDHFTHIKHVTLKQQRMAVLSHGRYEVVKILEWDTSNHLVYYLGTHDTRPGQRHLYVVKDPGADDPKRLEPQCITCDLGEVLWASRYHYGNCSYFNAAVSPPIGMEGALGHYVLECEGPGLPLAAIHASDTHRMIRIIFNTRHTRLHLLRKLALPISRSFSVPLPQGSKAQVQLFLPPSWREELRDAAYPVLVEVNGRPGSQSVTQRFTIDWGTYMSSHNDVVYVKLDVRGAKGLGKRSLYRHLGGVEVQDQIVTMRYLLDTFGFLDRSRIAVWGWGYGGYVTTMLLGSQQNIFKCGIAVSPITDWLFYNSAFTERILGLPGDNYKGYVEADATQRARNIPSDSLYLIHGLADVTAPYQHGVALAKALADAGVIFKYQSYADEGHFLVGVLAHVYRSMEHHLKECLSLDEDEHSL
ncbi:hypothetical protein RUM43_008879 [Polyplax serrata]|uniref:Dipeptidyl peptidase 4 n=1 Tax=Polyplax serrata TaxID=468196 RepID=A0AAN8S894_POLSC